MPDTKRHRYRQTLLFIAVLIVPSATAGMLGWKDFTRERERLVRDAEHRATEEFRLDLLQTLERIKLQALGGAAPDRALLFQAQVEHDRLVLPWDRNPAADRFRQSVEEPEFDSRMLRAAAAEFVEKKRVQERGGVFSYDPAIAIYREAAESARDDNQRVKARRELAAILERSGHRAEALSQSRELLQLPTGIVDDKRVPIAYYAADQLVRSAEAARPEVQREVIARAARDIESAESAPPGGVHILQQLLTQLAASSNPHAEGSRRLLDELALRIRFLERASAFQKAFPSLPLTASDWRVYSPALGAALGPEGQAPAPGHPGSLADAWLVSLTPSGRESNPRAVVVNAAGILDTVRSRQPQTAASMFDVSMSEGEPLGAGFPDLHVRRTNLVQPAAWSAVVQRPVYLLALLSVILLTFLGGFLVWRDTRREIHLAELRTQFVSSVSHELKTPLTAIRMFAEIMQMQGPVEVKKHNQHLDTIVSESERLTRLLNNVLDFSKIERGQKQYNLQTARLADIVDAAVRTMRYPLKQRGFDFHLDVDEGIPTVKVDRDAMEQAVLNLLSNAMKYSGHSRDIALRLCADNGSALIQVTDHGVGIPPEEHKRIFERFYRAPSTENQSISGTGLGLALVAHIMEAHGGKVELKSAAGEGSTFSLRIPIHPPIHAPMQAPVRREVQS